MSEDKTYNAKFDCINCGQLNQLEGLKFGITICDELTTSKIPCTNCGVILQCPIQ